MLRKMTGTAFFKECQANQSLSLPARAYAMYQLKLRGSGNGESEHKGDYYEDKIMEHFKRNPITDWNAVSRCAGSYEICQTGQVAFQMQLAGTIEEKDGKYRLTESQSQAPKW